jgi:hypothetical protein
VLIAFGRADFRRMDIPSAFTRSDVLQMMKLLERLETAVPPARDGSRRMTSGWLETSEARAFLRIALADDPTFFGNDPWEMFEKYLPVLVRKRVILRLGDEEAAC